MPRYLPDTPESRAELAQYSQSVARLDRGIGRLIDVLKEEGKYENTVLIYVSDNGMAVPGAKTPPASGWRHLQRSTPPRPP